MPPGIDPIITGDPGSAFRRTTRESAADRADRVFANIGDALHQIEDDQFGRIRSLTDTAHHTADAIYAVLGKTGVPLNTLKSAALAAHSCRSLSLRSPPRRRPPAWPRTNSTRNSQHSTPRSTGSTRQGVSPGRCPIATPVPPEGVSSGFGARVDPILGTPAFHPGLDLVAAYGTPIHATGDGIVVFAGRDGGYGNMVEIDHGNGLKTRYGHMSKSS